MGLKKAVEEIHKQFGKESIFKIGDKPQNLESISTGSPLLDKAIGTGGIPLGRIIEIFGPESSGKCLTKDMYILTPNGYKTIEEIFKESNHPTCCSNKIINFEYELINRFNKKEKTTNFTWNNKKPIFQIITSSGNKIKSTYNHPHLVISKIGNLVWKKTGELNKKDYIVTNRNICYFGEKSLNSTEAYLLGCFIADASFSEKNGICFTNDDLYIKNLIEKNFNIYFPFNKIRKYPNNNNGSFCYHFNKNDCKDFYKKYNIETGIAKDKKVPKIIRESNKETIKNFLQGYLDCECYVKNYLEVSSSSEQLLQEIKLLLLQFGIIGNIKEKNVIKYPENKYWTLYICGDNFREYCKKIGFQSKTRKQQYKTDNLHSPNKDSIPNVNLLLEDLFNSFENKKGKSELFSDYKGNKTQIKLTYQQLEKILKFAPKNLYITKYFQYLYDQNYYFDKIEQIIPLDKEETFDFAMSETSSFICNGVITHNTTLALHIIAEAQKKGKNAAFIDAEHSLDLKYASNIGINIDDLWISQPQCGEEALEIVDTLSRSNDVSVIVVDSVAALVPKAELEGEMGQSVPETVPILVRDKYTKQAEYVSIGSLYRGSKKFYNKRYTNIYHKLKEKEVFTSNGWKNIKTVFFKKNVNNKKLCLTNTLNGITITTYDHSLFKNNQASTPNEFKIGDSIDVNIPEFQQNTTFINKDIAWILGYFCAEGSINKNSKKRFHLSDTKISNINILEYKLKNNFSVYIKRKTTTYKKKNWADIHIISISRNDILASLLNSCVDTFTKDKKIPKEILNAKKPILESFLDGYKAGDGNKTLINYSFSSSSLLMISGIAHIFNSLKFKYHINSNYRKNRKNIKPEYNITQVKQNIKKINRITKMIELPPTKYLYDIETEDGTFVGGAGFIIHHNSHMGLQSRLMSQALRKLTGISSKTNCAIIFVNQIRMKIGVIFGNPETTSGGNALKFYSSIRLDIRRKKKIMRDQETIGNDVLIKVVKNKVGAPFKTVDTCIMFGKGIYKEAEILECYIDNGTINRTGAWFTYKEENFQGKEKIIQYISDHPEEFPI
jgi:RecA/RadA recombinase